MSELKYKLQQLKTEIKKEKISVKGWAEYVALETEFSENYVKAVWKGQRYNSTIALALIKYFSTKKEEIIKELKSLKK